MYKIYFLLFSIAVFTIGSCNQQAKTEVKNNWSFFGDTINADNAIDAALLTKQLEGKDSLPVKVKGIIEAVCQKKGCWMKVKTEGDKTVMVRFKDYGFFVPKDAKGKEVVIDGYAFNDTTSVQMLRHYAEDDGKSKEEIEKINAPEINLSFEAKGVMIKND